MPHTPTTPQRTRQPLPIARTLLETPHGGTADPSSDYLRRCDGAGVGPSCVAGGAAGGAAGEGVLLECCCCWCNAACCWCWMEFCWPQPVSCYMLIDVVAVPVQVFFMRSCSGSTAYGATPAYCFAGSRAVARTTRTAAPNDAAELSRGPGSCCLPVNRLSPPAPWSRHHDLRAACRGLMRFKCRPTEPKFVSLSVC